MEKGANDSSSGFGFSDKKSSSNSALVGSMIGTHRQRSNLDREYGGGGGGTSGGVVGSAKNIGGANEVVGSIYHDGVISSSRGGAGRENLIAKVTDLQPFDIFPYNHTIPNKSPAGTMAATLEFPFTYAQWKELERQAMIYKYMISSVPVPSDLLFPLSRDFPAVDSSVSLNNSRYSKNGDPEPGRCKRTDGKKWRCSRDVAPHQKYCERHLHRGRPRSRKPVEVKTNAQNHKKTRTDQQTRSVPMLQSDSASSQQQLFAAADDQPLLLFGAETDLSICTPSYKEANRDLSLIMENEQQWQHLVEPSIGLANNDGFSVYSANGPIFQHQDYVEHQGLTFFPYPDFPAPEIELPNGFIDAWSVDNVNRRNNGNVESSICLNDGDLSPSLNLSMAMASGDILHKEMRTVELGNSCVSWGPFARGGPLGEALQPIGDSNPTSPYNSISTQATTVSSPSGVLQRTLFSHSDGSVCNSPIRF